MKKRMKNACIILVLLLCMFTDVVFSAQTKPFYGAHRGYCDEYPENTLISFQKAFDAGMDAIECDLYESTNGDLMIYHNATLKREGFPSVKIWEVNKKNRKNYPITSGNGIENYETVLIPTLEEVCKLVKENKGKQLYIHLKVTDGYMLSQSGADKIVKTLKKYKIDKKTVIFFNDTACLDLFSGTNMKMGRVASKTTAKEFKKLVRWSQKNNVKFLLLGKSKTIINKKLVEYAHNHGIQVGIYCAENKKEFSYTQKYDLDFCFSNKPFVKK